MWWRKNRRTSPHHPKKVGKLWMGDTCNGRPTTLCMHIRIGERIASMTQNGCRQEALTNLSLFPRFVSNRKEAMCSCPNEGIIYVWQCTAYTNTDPPWMHTCCGFDEPNLIILRSFGLSSYAEKERCYYLRMAGCRLYINCMWVAQRNKQKQPRRE